MRLQNPECHEPVPWGVFGCAAGAGAGAAGSLAKHSVTPYHTSLFLLKNFPVGYARLLCPFNLTSCPASLCFYQKPPASSAHESSSSSPPPPWPHRRCGISLTYPWWWWPHTLYGCGSPWPQTHRSTEHQCTSPKIEWDYKTP